MNERMASGSGVLHYEEKDKATVSPDENINHDGSELSPSGESGCMGSGCCNPRNPRYRFAGLFFMCFLGFGEYFSVCILFYFLLL